MVEDDSDSYTQVLDDAWMSGTLTDTEICTCGITFNMAMSNPEVLTSQAVNDRDAIPTAKPKFSITSRRVDTTRHRNMHAYCRNQHGDIETGNIYKLG